MNPPTIQESKRLEFISQLEETFPHLDQDVHETVVSIFLKQIDNYEKFQKKINKLTLDPEIKENIVAVAHKFFSVKKIETEAKDNKRKRGDVEGEVEIEAKKRQCLDASLDESKKRKGDKLENEKTKKICLEAEPTVSQPLSIEKLLKQRNPDIIPLAFTGTDEQLIQACEQVYQLLKNESVDLDNSLTISDEHVGHFMKLLSHENPQVAFSAWKCFSQLRKRVFYQTSFLKDKEREQIQNILKKFIHSIPENQHEIWVIQLKLLFDLVPLEECIAFLFNPSKDVQQLALWAINMLAVRQPHAFQDIERYDPNQLIKTILARLIDSSKETSRTACNTLTQLIKISILQVPFSQNQGFETILEILMIQTVNYKNSIQCQKQQNPNLKDEEKDINSIFLSNALIGLIDCIESYVAPPSFATSTRLSQTVTTLSIASKNSETPTDNLFSCANLKILIDMLLMLSKLEISNDLNGKAITCWGSLLRKLPNDPIVFKYLAPFFVLLKQDDPKILAKTLRAFAAMPSNPKTKEFLLQHKAMDILIFLLSHSNEDVIINALRCLNWAELTGTSIDNICEEKILTKLESKNENIICHTLRSLNKLCERNTFPMRLGSTVIKQAIPFVRSKNENIAEAAYWVLGILVNKGLAQEVYNTGIVKDIKATLANEESAKVIEGAIFCLSAIESSSNVITVESAQEKIDYYTHLLSSPTSKIVEGATWLLHRMMVIGNTSNVNESNFNQIINLLASQNDNIAKWRSLEFFKGISSS